MAVHFFHCTDGFDFVLDRVGQNTRSRQDLHVAACLVANRMMRALPPDADWSNWVVSVQNRKGRMVDVIPFPVEARAGAPREAAWSRPARCARQRKSRHNPVVETPRFEGFDAGKPAGVRT